MIWIPFEATGESKQQGCLIIGIHGSTSNSSTGSQLLITRAPLLNVLDRIQERVQRYTDQLSGCSWHRNAATIPLPALPPRHLQE